LEGPHHGEHPKQDLIDIGTNQPELKEMVDAARVSRLQKSGFKEHQGYHKEFYGPILPRDHKAGIVVTVMGSGLYVAEKVLDIRNGGEVVLERKLRERKWEKDEIYFADDLIARYFRSLLIDTVLGMVDLEDSETRQFAAVSPNVYGRKLIREAADILVEPVRENYSDAYNQGFIKPSKPAGAAELFVTQAGLKREHVREDLEKVLRLEIRARLEGLSQTAALLLTNRGR
jgi:hypothetical protein